MSHLYEALGRRVDTWRADGYPSGDFPAIGEIFEWASDPDTGTTLDATEEPGLLVARLDAVGPSTLSVWALGSEAGATAAARALAVAVDAGVL